MVTYLLCQEKPKVRFLPPPPVLFILLFLAVCIVPSEAASFGESDQDSVDYYETAPYTLVDYLVQPYSLVEARSTYRPFGISFTTSVKNGDEVVTSARGVSYLNRADGVQDLATLVLDLALGIQDEVDTISLDNSSWLEQIYNKLVTIDYNTDAMEGKLQNIYTQNADNYKALSDLISSSISERLKPSFSIRDGYGTSRTVNSIADSLAYFQNFMTDSFYYTGGYLRSDGSVLFPSGRVLYSYILSNGLQGLGTLLSGAVGSDYPVLDGDGSSLMAGRGKLSVSEILGQGFTGLASILGGPNHGWNEEYGYLDQNGYTDSSRTSLMAMTGQGFVGLAQLLMGDRDKSDTQWPLFEILSPDDGTSIVSNLRYHDIGHLLGDGFTALQNPLARLAYVYADQDDIDFKHQEEGNMDAAKDEFFGDGQASVKPSNIKDAAGITSGVSDALSGAGSISDIWSVLKDGDSWGFFSQEVYDDMNGLSPDTQDDDLFEGYILGEDGFYRIDLSPWDVDSYLERVS